MKPDPLTALVEENVLRPVYIGTDWSPAPDHEATVARNEAPDFTAEEIVALREWEQTGHLLGAPADGYITYREAAIIAGEIGNLPGSPLARALGKISRCYAVLAQEFFKDAGVNGFRYAALDAPLVGLAWREDGLAFTHQFGARLYLTWDPEHEFVESQSILDTDSPFVDLLSIEGNSREGARWADYLQWWADGIARDSYLMSLLQLAADERRAGDEAAFLEHALAVNEGDSTDKIRASRKFVLEVARFHLDPSNGGAPHLAAICSEMRSPALAAMVARQVRALEEGAGAELMDILARNDASRAAEIQEMLQQTEAVRFEWGFLGSNGGERVFNATALSEEDMAGLGNEGALLPPPMEEMESALLKEWRFDAAEERLLNKMVLHYRSSPGDIKETPPYFQEAVRHFSDASEAGQFTTELFEGLFRTFQQDAARRFANDGDVANKWVSIGDYPVHTSAAIELMLASTGNRLMDEEGVRPLLYRASALMKMHRLLILYRDDPWAQSIVSDLMAKTENETLTNDDLDAVISAMPEGDAVPLIYEILSDGLVRGLISEGIAPKYWIDGDTDGETIVKARRIRGNTSSVDMATCLHMRHAVEAAAEAGDWEAFDAGGGFEPVWRAYRNLDAAGHEDAIPRMRLVLIDPTVDLGLVRRVGEDATAMMRHYDRVHVTMSKRDDPSGELTMTAESGRWRKHRFRFVGDRGAWSSPPVFLHHPKSYFQKKYADGIRWKYDREVTWDSGRFSYASPKCAVDLDIAEIVRTECDEVDVDQPSSISIAVSGDLDDIASRRVDTVTKGDFLRTGDRMFEFAYFLSKCLHKINH